MASISFNGNSNVPQPSTLAESYIQKVIDRTSILGVRHRYWLAARYEVKMTFTALTPAQVQQMAVIFYNAGNGVTYANPESGLTFFGYPLVAEEEYIRGSSYLKNMNVTLEQQ